MRFENVYTGRPFTIGYLFAARVRFECETGKCVEGVRLDKQRIADISPLLLRQAHIDALIGDARENLRPGASHILHGVNIYESDEPDCLEVF